MRNLSPQNCRPVSRQWWSRTLCRIVVPLKMSTSVVLKSMVAALAEQRDFNIEAWAKSEHHAGKTRVARAQFVQNEQYRRR